MEAVRRSRKRAQLLAVVLPVAFLLVTGGARAAEFHSETSPTTLVGEATGTQTFFLGVGGPEVACKTVAMEGVVAALTAIEFDLAPSYSECTSSNLAASVKMNGCKFKLTLTGAGEKHPADIVCPVGAKMEISSIAFSCAYLLGAQMGREGVVVTLKGTGSTRDFTLDFELKGISYERGGSSSCKSVGADLSYGGPVTAKGFKGGVQVGIWIE